MTTILSTVIECAIDILCVIAVGSAQNCVVATVRMASTIDNTNINRFQVLCHEQVYRLDEMMEGAVSVHGRGNFPTLNIQLKELVRVVRDKLEQDGVTIRDVRLNGGAASYILGCEEEQIYNDLDLIFGVDLATASDFQKVKNAVLNSLLEFLPEGVNRERMSSCSLKEAYVQKMVKINTPNDRWSLISLSNNRGRNVELKFVDRMKRQFEFSVDSFQIILNSLLAFYDISETPPMDERFYPTVVAESVYGDFSLALFHLNNKLIATRSPEEIRGGGLFKYCNLLVRGYVPADVCDIKPLERYMCSRFFIDFPDVYQQRQKLEKYLVNHLSDALMRYNYLMTLYSVVDHSTICLMGHERRQALSLIQHCASHILMQQEQRAFMKQRHMQHFDSDNFTPVTGGALTVPTLDQPNDLIIDQVYYGTSYTLPPLSSDQYYGYAAPYMISYPQVGGGCPTCPSYLQC